MTRTIPVAAGRHADGTPASRAHERRLPERHENAEGDVSLGETATDIVEFSDAVRRARGADFDPERFDRDMADRAFDANGFDQYGVHRDTGDFFGTDGRDRRGLDADGYDNDGYTRMPKGYDTARYPYDQRILREGVRRESDGEWHTRDGRIVREVATGWKLYGKDDSGIWRDSLGYDLDGFDRSSKDSDGYDRSGFKDGWNRESINEETGTRYDASGFDREGNDPDGFSAEGWRWEADRGTSVDRDGYNGAGFDRDGFNRAGMDRDGRDRDGFDQRGWRKSRRANGWHVELDRAGFDQHGYDVNGVHRDTGTPFDSEGFNFVGRDADGYNRNGRDIDGYDRDGFKVEYRGYSNHKVERDREGYDRNGFNDRGRDRDGFDKNGLNAHNFDRSGKHRDTGTDRDRYGFDKDGLSRSSRSSDDPAAFVTNPETFDRMKAHAESPRMSARLLDAYEMKKFIDGIEAYRKKNGLTKVQMKGAVVDFDPYFDETRGKNWVSSTESTRARFKFNGRGWEVQKIERYANGFYRAGGAELSVQLAE